MSSKFSILDLASDHFTTLRNHSTGRVSRVDLLFYVGVPLAAASWVYLAGGRARHLPEVLAAVAILTGLIFNVFVLLFDLTMKAERSDPARRREIFALAGELRANISYAVLLGITLTAFLGGYVMFSSSQTEELSTPLSAVIVFVSVQLLLTILMVLRRVRALYRAYVMVEPDRVP